MGGNFGKILAHFRELQFKGPPRGYFLEPRKIILVVAPHNVTISKELFQGMFMTVVTGSRYLSGFIGDKEA